MHDSDEDPQSPAGQHWSAESQEDSGRPSGARSSGRRWRSVSVRTITRMWSALAALLADWGSVLTASFARWESAVTIRVGRWFSALGALFAPWWSRLTATRGWSALAAFAARCWRVLGTPTVRWWSTVTASRPVVRRGVPAALAALIVLGPVFGAIGGGGDPPSTPANMADALVIGERSTQPTDPSTSQADGRSTKHASRSENREATQPQSRSAAKPTAAATTAPSPSKPAHPAPVGGLSQVQMDHAKTIVEVGEQMNLPRQAYIVAISTSLQETGLLNMANWGLDESLNQPHDGVGSDHDSVGLFQQRPSSGWGTVQECMDPATASRRFYEALEQVPGWEGMPVTVAAQTVQHSAFPDAYAQHVTLATEIVDALS